VQVDLRVVLPESYGAALMYFTGSKEHNIKIREMAVKKGLKINEYGVFNVKSGKKIGGRSEAEIYGIFKMGYIEPELREDAGEIESALRGDLPELIRLSDIKGDFHIHTEASDGTLSLSGIAEIARRKGYEYAVITDHSVSLKVAGGLRAEQLMRQKNAVSRINGKLRGIRLLSGSEVDILDNGSLDYGDDLLKKLDFVIAAIHTGFNQPADKLTARIIKAMRNKHVNVIAHPSGRLMGQRPAYELDYDKIFAAAAETGTAIEINSHPARLDLTDANCRRAKKAGVKLAISTDAHFAVQFDDMFYGVGVARRGWLEKEDVINALPLKELLKFARQKRL
jgi:DNA polymerase (family 10)